MKLIQGLLLSFLTLSFLPFCFTSQEVGCWAFQQNKEKCLTYPTECQWCNLGGEYGEFCAPIGKQNCLASNQELDTDRQCLMVGAKALYDQRSNEIYTQDVNKRWDGIFDNVMPPNAPKYSDCSSSVSWIYWTCFKDRKDFINGENWQDGWTGSLDQHGTKISLSQAEPGDLVFYGNPVDHVAIYIGSGRVISHGSDPVCNCDVHYRNDLAEVRTYLSSNKVKSYYQQCSDFDYQTCLAYPNDCVYIGCNDKGCQGCIDKRDLIKEVNCDKLNREECFEHLQECIYVGDSYGCIFRNKTFLGDIQSQIQHSTSDYWGRSTSSGPDGGVEACAWAVNNIISNSGYRRVGDNPNYVPSVVDALKAGRGRQIQAIQAVPGDLVVACGEQHIGVCMENKCNTIDSNSSSRRCFCWRSGFNFDNYFNCGPATYWRLEN